MKKTAVLTLALLMAFACLAGPAQARKGPIVYNQARAIPTQSGENVRITLYTKRINALVAWVDDSRRMKPVRFGKGCGEKRCDKWKLYAVRGDDECYDITYETRNPSGAGGLVTACEPFRDGSI